LYDVLNVMIAAGIIIKDRKTVSFEFSPVEYPPHIYNYGRKSFD
jgi:hypothetical protein